MKANVTYIISIITLAAIVLYAISAFAAKQVKNELESTQLALDAHISKQEMLVMSVADLTKQSGADEITSQIVVDCLAAERQRFESLLDKLSDKISLAELRELDSLFYKCGSFYADRKAVMAGRLTREVAVYRDYINLHDQVGRKDDQAIERSVLWQQVADKEMEVAAQFALLVDLQKEIIMTLLSGKDKSAPELTSTLTKVAEVKANMTILIKQIENTRQELQLI